MDDGLPRHVIEQDGSVSEQSTEELAIRIREGSVSYSSYIWRVCMSDWRSLSPSSQKEHLSQFR